MFVQMSPDGRVCMYGEALPVHSRGEVVMSTSCVLPVCLVMVSERCAVAVRY